MTILRNVLSNILSAPLFIPTAVSEAVDAYLFGGQAAALVIDHAGVLNEGVPYYRKQGVTCTYDELFSTRYDRSDPATMFNSSGNLVWSCHNFFTSTTALANFSGATVTNDNAADPNGDLTFDTLADDGVGGTGVVGAIFGGVTLVSGAMSWGVIVTEPTTRYFHMDFANITNTQGRVIFDWDTDAATEEGANVVGTSLTDLGGGYKLARVVWDATGADVVGNAKIGLAVNPTGNPNNVPKDGTNSMTVGAPRANRAFGAVNGMAPVPEDVRTFSVDDSYIAPVTTTPIYLARRESYDPNGGTPVLAGQLQEQARTNDVTYSRDFTNAFWTKTNTSAAMDETGIDGQSNTAATITDSGGGSGTCQLSSNYTVNTSSTYTWSAVFKAGTIEMVGIYTSGFTTPANHFSYFTLTGGGSIPSEGGDHTALVKDLGNDKVLVSITFDTDPTDTLGQIIVYMAEAVGDISITRDGTKTYIISDAQMEEGSVPSSRIPTNGSAITRATDVVTGQVLAADVPNSTEALWFAMHGRMSYADNGVSVGPDATSGEAIFFRRAADTGNFIVASLNTGSTATGQVLFLQEVGAVNDFVSTSATALSPGVDVPVKIAARYGSSYVQGAIAGTATSENSTPTSLADLSSTDFDIGVTFSGNVGMIIAGTGDPGETGIEEAST